MIEFRFYSWVPSCELLFLRTLAHENQIKPRISVNMYAHEPQLLVFCLKNRSHVEIGQFDDVVNMVIRILKDYCPTYITGAAAFVLLFILKLPKLQWRSKN